VQLLSEI